MEGEGCVDQVGVYDEPGASLAMWCYLGTLGMVWLWVPDLVVCECAACVLGAWRVRVVSTKLEYTTSLGQVLPWGATWAPLEMDTCGG